MQERIDTLEGFFEYASFFFTGEVAYDAEAQKAHGAEGPHARRGVEGAARRCSRRSSTRSSTGGATRSRRRCARFAEKAGWPAGDLFMAVRVAATGRAASPPLFETLAVLGKETCRRRLRRAAETLKAIK